MSGLQPVQRVGGCRQHGLRGQAQRRELRAPQRRARRTILVRGQQQPDCCVRGQFGDQRERAPVRRLAGVAGDQEARGGGVGQRVEDAAAFLARVEPAGDLDAGGVVAGGQGRSVGSSSASSTGRPSSPAGAGADRRGCSGSTDGPGRWRPRRVPAGRAAAWPGSAGRCAGRRACAAARPGTAARRPAGAARHRPPPRRSAIATIAPGRRPARSGRRRWRAPWRRRAAGSPPGPAASRSPGQPDEGVRREQRGGPDEAVAGGGQHRQQRRQRGAQPGQPEQVADRAEQRSARASRLSRAWGASAVSGPRASLRVTHSQSRPRPVAAAGRRRKLASHSRKVSACRPAGRPAPTAR